MNSNGRERQLCLCPVPVGDRGEKLFWVGVAEVGGHSVGNAASTTSLTLMTPNLL